MAVFDATLGKVVVDVDLGGLTNNEAEYRAIAAALDYAVGETLGPVELRSDSQLCVNQINGQWKVKEARLQPLVKAAREKLRANGGRITWVRRDENLASHYLEGSATAETSTAPFCQRCGTRTVERKVDHRTRPVCPSCGWKLF